MAPANKTNLATSAWFDAVDTSKPLVSLDALPRFAQSTALKNVANSVFQSSGRNLASMMSAATSSSVAPASDPNDPLADVSDSGSDPHGNPLLFGDDSDDNSDGGDRSDSPTPPPPPLRPPTSPPALAPPTGTTSFPLSPPSDSGSSLSSPRGGGGGGGGPFASMIDLGYSPNDGGGSGGGGIDLSSTTGDGESINLSDDIAPGLSISDVGDDESLGLSSGGDGLGVVEDDMELIDFDS